jgi:hypothetical protein
MNADKGIDKTETEAELRMKQERDAPIWTVERRRKAPQMNADERR